MLVGDFNCTLDQAVDRNHEEPHPFSAEALRSLINYHSFTYLWTLFQGLGSIPVSNRILMKCQWQDLIIFMLKANNQGRFFGVTTDHHYISMTVSDPFIKSYSLYWHFNNILLKDNSFIHAFR